MLCFSKFQLPATTVGVQMRVAIAFILLYVQQLPASTHFHKLNTRLGFCLESCQNIQFALSTARVPLPPLAAVANYDQAKGGAHGFVRVSLRTTTRFQRRSKPEGQCTKLDCHRLL